MKAALAAAATVVALAFTLLLFERWRARRRRHEAAWTVSLALFTVASGALWVGAAAGWSAATFRVFFLFGAVLNVPWLALGTVELLAGERWGRPTRAWLVAFSAFAAGIMLETPLKAQVPAHDLPQGRQLFGVLPRVLAAVCSGGAALVVIGGALWSAWRLWRGRSRTSTAAPVPVAVMRGLAGGNVLIALGTLVLSASGTLNGRLGAEKAFAVTLTVGIVVLFAGFLVATNAGRVRAGATAALVATAA